MMVVWRQCPILWFVICGQRVSSQQSLDQAGRGYVTSVTTAEEYIVRRIQYTHGTYTGAAQGRQRWQDIIVMFVIIRWRPVFVK